MKFGCPSKVSIKTMFALPASGLMLRTMIIPWAYLAQFFLEWEMFQTEVVEKIKTYILSPIFLFWKIVLFMKCGGEVHNSMLLTSTLSQINPVHFLLFYFLQIHFNIFLPPTPRPSTRSVLSGIPSDIPSPCLVSTMHAAYSTTLFLMLFRGSSNIKILPLCNSLTLILLSPS